MNGYELFTLSSRIYHTRTFSSLKRIESLSNSEPASEKGTKVSRRGVIKWAGALAAAGVVGVGLGFGGDLLVRPNSQTTLTETSLGTETVTATQTQTSTATVTQPPVTKTATTTATSTATQTVTTTSIQQPTSLSYIPPLSSSVQSKVDAQFQALAARHQGETVIQSGCNQCQYSGPCVLRVHVKNGAVTAIETDNRVLPNVPRDDASATQQDIIHWNFNLRASCPIGRTLHYNDTAPNRMIYPMKNIGTKGAGSNFVRISWKEALTTIATKLQYYKNTYGPYSIISGPWGVSRKRLGTLWSRSWRLGRLLK